MKLNIKKYMLALGITSILLPSCNDDFMERYPLDKITDESFWKSETDLKMMLNHLLKRLEQNMLLMDYLIQKHSAQIQIF